MRSNGFVAVFFCALVIGCSHQEDTKHRQGWLRPLQPRLMGATKWQPCRLSLAPGRIVEDAACGTARPAPAAKAICDDILSTHEEAVRLLVERPACIDDAITALERFARADPAAGSDLAAAYYARAQAGDHASDLLSALDAADHAVARAPGLIEARFNRALTLEAAGLRTEAIAAWEEVRNAERGPWAAEAKAHADRLKDVPDAGAQWAANHAQLPAALAAHDRNTVARLIAPFPVEAQHELEDVLLPRWAAAADAENLDEAQILAGELARLTGNRFPVDAVNSLETDSPAKREALKQGLLAFRDARLVDRAIKPDAAASNYEKAKGLLETGGSPLALPAGLGRAVAISFVAGREGEALSALDALEARARAHGYAHLVARMDANRAYFLFWQSRYVESFAELEKALKEYAALGDTEAATATRLQWIGNYRAVGQNELSWREALQMTRRLPELVDAQARHTVLGDTAATVLALGHPEIALRYQNAGIAVIRSRLLATPPERVEELERLQKNLSVAFRERARIELNLDRYGDAEADLNEAIRRVTDATNKERSRTIRDAVQARIEEVKGQELLRVNPEQAAAAFTRAIALVANDSYRTFRASLLAQRAEAQRLVGRTAAEQADLQAAITELRAEEVLILERRRRGEAEGVWSSYFSRFQDTYRLLISQFAGNHQWEEALSYAERARGLEPLNLVLRTNVVPPAFRGLTNGEPLALAEIQRALPAGTFLIEFSLLADRTCTWIISHDTFELLQQDVRAPQIERWTMRLQRAARTRNGNDLQAALLAPSHELFARPLSVIRQLNRQRSTGGGALPHLVIIPDGALHGIPFAALRNPETGRYLIEDATVSTAGSATLYVYSLLRDRALPRQKYPSVLLVRDPAYDPSLPFAQGLARLEGAKRESDAIASIYEPRAKVLRDEFATVPRFLTEAGQCDVLHFAGHAVANEPEPFRSLLLLAPSQHDSGMLDAATLVRNLRADHARLAILSTCSSAGGLPVGPEGVAPLVRPLIGAGIPAVIGSLWDVDDATATQLLVSFHRDYRKGSNAAIALREAQLHLLHSPNAGLASVLAWAPFELIGNASSPFGDPPREIKGEPP